MLHDDDSFEVSGAQFLQAGDVFPQDVERIQDLLEEITELMKKCAAAVLAKRQKAQEKLIEKNEENL